MATNPTDRSLKKLLNKRVTSEDKKVYEEIGDVTLTVTTEQIWADDIPNNNPLAALSDNTAAFSSTTLLEDFSVQNQQSWYAFSGVRLKDWIPDRFGPDYQVKLFDNNNNQIFPTHPVGWTFDYPTGILTFENTPSSLAQPFRIDGYRYIGARANRNTSDYRIVKTIAERDSIPVEERTVGMVVRLVDGTRFSLGANLTNLDWNLLSFDGYTQETTELTLYVDIVNGNDNNNGTVSSPLLTIQRAVDKFIPPGKSTAEWERNITKTVRVVWTPGMPDITEFVHVPYHKGEGTLVITADEEVAYSGLTQSGGLVTGGVVSPDGYGNIRQGVNLTTSPMTAGELANTHFIRPVVNPNENQIEFAYEFAPILANSTGSIDFVMAKPGAQSGFGYANGMVFDVVRPQVKWHHPSNQNFLTFSSAPLLKIDGGMVEISGFDFTNSGYSRTVIDVNSPGSLKFNNLTNSITRCLFKETGGQSNHTRFFAGSGLWVAGCIYNHSGGLFADGLANSLLYNINCVDRGTNSQWNIYNTTNLSFIGLYVDGGFLSSRNNINSQFNDIYFKNHKVEMVKDTISAFFNFSFVDSKTDGIEFESCHILALGSSESYSHNSNGYGIQFIGTYVGSFSPGTSFLGNLYSGFGVQESSAVHSRGGFVGTGNQQYGVEVSENSYFSSRSLAASPTPLSTLTGTLGNLKVGDSSVQQWGSGSTTDLVQLCRFKEVI